MPVIGVGTVHLLMIITIPNPEGKVLKNLVPNSVLHALESKESLISGPCLTERGLNVKFYHFGAVITGQRSVEGIFKKIDPIYVIGQCSDDSEQVHVVTTNDINLWHRPLGHIDNNMIGALHKTFTEMPQIKKVIGKERSVDSLVGKMERLSFPRKFGLRATQPLAIVHVDICGPISVMCVGGNKYFMICTDDWSNWRDVSFFAMKSNCA